MTGSPLWYVSRATGVVSFVLLTLVVVLGIVVQRQRPLVQLPRFVAVGLHRNASLLVVLLLVVHVPTAILDTYVDLRWQDAFVPFIAHYDQLWVGLGTFALDLLLCLVVTSLLRARLAPRVWRAIHLTSYGLWPLVALHAVFTSKDLQTSWGLPLALTCDAAVVGAVCWRLLTISGERSARVPALLKAPLAATPVRNR